MPRSSWLDQWDRRNQRAMERSGTAIAARPFTRRRHALIAAGLSVVPLAWTALDSWSLWRGIIAGLVAYPFMALALMLVRRTGVRSQLTGVTIMLAMPFLCSIGIGQRLPTKRGGDGPPAPTGAGLVGLLLLVVLAAFALAAVATLLGRREHDDP